MSIEIKQMIIKSNLVNGRSEKESHEHEIVDIEQLKETLMEECKALIAESLSELQER